MKLWTVFVKELKILLKDKNALIQFFLIPILVITLANYAMQKLYTNGSEAVINVPVVDNDATPTSKQFIHILKTIKIINIEETYTENSQTLPMSGDYARRMITKENTRYVALVIPKGFEKHLLGALPVEITLLENPFEKISPIITKSMLDRLVSRIIFKSDETGSAKLSVARETPLVVVKEESQLQATGSKMDSLKQNVPGFAIMFALFSLVWGSLSIVNEREKGTFARLLSAPVSKFSILAGKLLIMFLIACAQLLVFFSFGHFIFGMDLGRSLAGLVLLSMALAFTTTSLGVFLASFAKTQMQLGAISSIIVLGMSALGGSWWPSEFMPDFMRQLAHFLTINAWAMDGYKALLWYGHGLIDVLPEIGVLSALAVIMFFLGVWKFRFE